MGGQKNFVLTSVAVERYKRQRFAWCYLHPRPPRAENADAAAEFAVLLRGLEGCVRAVSSGDDLDLTYEFEDGLTFRYSYDGIHGMVIECAERDTARLKDRIAPLCAVGAD